MCPARIPSFLLVLSLLATPGFGQAAGDLDTSFADGGTFVLLRPSEQVSVYARDVILDAAGNLVVVGSEIGPGAGGGPVVLRLLPDGTLDDTFGLGTGVVRPQDEFPIDTPRIEADQVVIDSNGCVVVAGFTSPTPDGEFALFRLCDDGLLDTGFGEGGIARLNPTAGVDWLTSLVLQRDGGDEKIVAAGIVFRDGDQHIAVARFDSSGALDPSFGIGGLFVEDFGWQWSYAEDLLIENNQKIVVIARVRQQSDSDVDLAVLALRRNGTLDPSFGTGGVVTVDFGGSYEYGYGAAFDGRKIVAAGFVLDFAAGGLASSFDLAVVRLTFQGALDTSFNQTGFVRTDLGSFPDTVSDDLGWDVAIQPDRKIVVVGRAAERGQDTDVLVLRYLSDGQLDAAFGTDGVVVTPVSRFDEAYAVALQPDGKIVAAGFSDSEGPNQNVSDLLVLRYHGLSALPAELALFQEEIRELWRDGLIQGRRARSLIGKLQLAVFFLERGGEPIALQTLQLFRLETRLAIAFGQVDPGAGQQLIDRVDMLIVALGG